MEAWFTFGRIFRFRNQSPWTPPAPIPGPEKPLLPRVSSPSQAQTHTGSHQGLEVEPPAPRSPPGSSPRLFESFPRTFVLVQCGASWRRLSAPPLPACQPGSVRKDYRSGWGVGPLGKGPARGGRAPRSEGCQPRSTMGELVWLTLLLLLPLHGPASSAQGKMPFLNRLLPKGPERERARARESVQFLGEGGDLETERQRGAGVMRASQPAFLPTLLAISMGEERVWGPESAGGGRLSRRDVARGGVSFSCFIRTRKLGGKGLSPVPFWPGSHGRPGASPSQ